MLKIYNTLTKQKEEFKPLKEGRVGMYHCGPTVYDFVHIGNIRAYVLADVLRRTLEWGGYKVRQVVNITDFGHLSSDADEGEDKMLKGLKREGKPFTLEAMRELAGFYAEKFNEDLAAFNIESPTVLPYASDHIPEQIDIIKGLEAKGFTYQTTDGVYFDTTKDPTYGKLGGLSGIDEQQKRIAENSEKKNPRDFALWKLSSPAHEGADDAQKHAEQTPAVAQSSLRGAAQNNAERITGWDSPWGTGFPGWHIECSAMSMKYLGNHFDIHTGGIDHIPIHHNNELAQSENFTGEPFVNYWMHNEWVRLSGEKIAKSAGGFITRRDLEEKGFDPLSYRYWLLTAHYRTPVDFTWEALEAAQSALYKLYDRVLEPGAKDKIPDTGYVQKFTETINDDLNTPKALAIIWDMFKDSSLDETTKAVTVLKFNRVLGLGFDKLEAIIFLPDNITKLIVEREEARKNGDWDTADSLREEIEKLGYNVKDTESGPVAQKKSGK